MYPSLDSLEAIEGTCDQRGLWSDCAGRASLIVVVRWLTFFLFLFVCRGAHQKRLRVALLMSRTK